jgi:hypothetical protein
MKLFVLAVLLSPNGRWLLQNADRLLLLPAAELLQTQHHGLERCDLNPEHTFNLHNTNF